MRRPWLRYLSIALIGLAFIAAGVNHFRHPELYRGVMPPWLPWPEMLQLIAGAAEIAGGIGVLLPWTRRAAGFGLIALLIAVFPANVQMALTGFPGTDLPGWVLWARLPFQPLMIAWVWWACVRKGEVRDRASAEVARGAP